MQRFDPAVFKDHFTAGRTQLAWEWIAGDMETAVSLYRKLFAGAKHSFLLESVEGGATLGRYSIVGGDPDVVWSPDKTQKSGAVLASLRDTLAACRIDAVPDGLPPMAVSGLFGYLGYGMVRLIENVPDTKPDDLDIPDAVLVRPRLLAIVDNARAMICLVAPVYAHANNAKDSADTVLREAQSRLQQALDALKKPAPALQSAKAAAPAQPASNTPRARFEDMVKKAIAHTLAGDIFQVVLSQRFSVPFAAPAFALYRALRRLNPSPFLFFLEFGDFALVGSSPEILVRVRSRKITIRPIAGTRPRGATPEEDTALEESLLADPKERAEHLMLLDLGRNDAGRVSAYGSVKPTAQFTVERYSHVMHIVSNVEGTLKPEHDAIDALLAGFPAGTVSGAPKIRAMEIIDDLETARRSYYGGGVGYLSGNGDMDTCIALRTALVKDGMLYVQAGAGIVADSDPASEYQETVNKAAALFKAAEEAARGE